MSSKYGQIDIFRYSPVIDRRRVVAMGRLSQEQKTFYKNNGYIILKNVLPEEDLRAITEEYDKLFARKNQEKMESSWVGTDADDRKNTSEFTVST